MTKSWEEYYNDPRIIDEHPFLREIHATRLLHADEREGLTAEEHTALVNKNTEVFMAEYAKRKELT